MNVRMDTTQRQVGEQLVPLLRILRSLILGKPILQVVLQVLSVIIINALHARIAIVLLDLQQVLKPQFVLRLNLGRM